MVTVAAKRKLSTKSIKEKYAALKKVEDGSSKFQVAMKYGVPKNTLSIWIKNKERIFESMKTQGNKTKRMRLEEGTFVKLDELIFKWLLTVRSKNVVVSASILKTKAKEFAGKIDIKGFQASDGWLDRWKNRYNVMFLSRQYLEKITLVRLKYPHHGKKQLSLQFYPSTNLMKFIMQMNLGHFFVCSLISHSILDLSLAQWGNTAKFEEKKKVALIIDTAQHIRQSIISNPLNLFSYHRIPHLNSSQWIREFYAL